MHIAESHTQIYAVLEEGDGVGGPVEKSSHNIACTQHNIFGTSATRSALQRDQLTAFSETIDTGKCLSKTRG